MIDSVGRGEGSSPLLVKGPRKYIFQLITTLIFRDPIRIQKLGRGVGKEMITRTLKGDKVCFRLSDVNCLWAGTIEGKEVKNRRGNGRKGRTEKATKGRES